MRRDGYRLFVSLAVLADLDMQRLALISRLDENGFKGLQHLPRHAARQLAQQSITEPLHATVEARPP
jgi:hypothetical protein